MTEINNLPSIAPADVTDDDLILIWDVGAASQKSRKSTRAHFLKDVVRTVGEFLVERINFTDGLAAPVASIDELTVNTSMTLGATISKVLVGFGSITIPSTAAGAQSSVALAMTGAQVGDIVTINAPADLPVGLILRAAVTGTSVVTVYAFNATAATIASGLHAIRAMAVRVS
jgi:hypothetical protein